MLHYMPVSLQDLALDVKRLQYRHHRALDSRLRSIDTTLPQWDALRAIASHPESSSHALAELTFQTDQSFGALANRLVQRGMIERVAGPGRAVHHRLTRSGEATLKAGHPIVNQVFAESFAGLSDTQRDQLHKLLARTLAAPPERPTRHHRS
jgi:DNA-binding MarR family transcriptional regulator